MRVVEKLFKFYVDASIHVALAVVSLFLITVKTLNIIVSPHLSYFIFFSSIVCYNFIKYGVEAEKYFIVDKPYYKYIQIFSFLCVPFLLFSFFQLSKQLWLITFGLVVLSALYAIPFLPNSKNLRSLAGLKIFLVALVWVGVTVLLPVIEAKLFLDGRIGVLCVQRFVLVIILLIPFEIRDLNYDAVDLKTLPQRFGVLKTKYIGYVLVGCYFILALILYFLGLNRLWLTAVLSVLLLVLLYFCNKSQHKYYASFWVEGVPVLGYFLYVVSQNL